MKKPQFLKLFLIGLVPVFIVVPVSFAKSTAYNSQPVVVEKDEVIEDDFFAAANSVTINGTVNGDVYAVGERIVITGTVNGDVYTAGGVVNISGNITDDLVVAGGTVSIDSAEIGDGLKVAGGTVTISDKVSIQSSLLFGAGTMTNNAVINRGMYGGAGTLDFGGNVSKNAWIFTEIFTANDDAVIQGNLSYMMENEADLPSTLTVTGSTEYIDPATYSAETDFGWNRMGEGHMFQRANLGFQLWSYSAALLIGLLFLYFFGDVAKNVAHTLRKNIWGSLGWGVLVLFGAFPVITLIMMTVVGIPLGLLLTMLFFLEMYFAKIFVGVVYGSFIEELVLKNQAPNMYINFALGLAIYYVIGFIPFVNLLQMILSVVLTFGAVFIVKRQRFFTKTQGQ